MVSKSIQNLKARARVSMINYMSPAVGSMTIYMLLVLVITEVTSFSLPENPLAALVFSFLVNFLVAAAVGVVQLGLKSIYLDIQFGNAPKFLALFRYFRENQNSAVVIAGFFGLFDTVSSLPLMIVILNSEENAIFTLPMVLAFAFRSLAQFLFRAVFFPAPYLLMDFPEMRPSAIIKNSEKLMRDKRLDYIKLTISYIPLHLLGLLSMGIGSLWVMAYQNCAHAALYQDMINERKKARAAASPVREKPEKAGESPS